MGSNLRVPLFRQMQDIARFKNQIKDLFWSRVKLKMRRNQKMLRNNCSESF